MSIQKDIFVEKLENPPDDPTAPYFLTYCYVCTEQAKPNQEHIRNYGAIVCFSCRAFWRRTFQKTRSPNYVCKNNSECVLIAENRRSCQKCRYDRCVTAGMHPDAVLSDKQKEVRFQKFMQKKRGDISISGNAAGVSGSSNGSSDKNDQQPRKKPGRKKVGVVVKLEQISPGDSDEAMESSTSADDDEESAAARRKPAAVILSESMTKMKKKMESKVTKIVENYKSMIKCSHVEFANLLSENVNKRQILNYLMKISDEFQTLAFSFMQFSRLGRKDQELLLARNTPIYIQFFIGCCLLLGHDQVRKNEDLKNWKHFLSLVKAFKPGCDVNQYFQLFSRLVPLSQLGNADQQAILSYIILFDVNDTLNVDQYEDLDDIEMLNSIMFASFIFSEDSSLDRESLIETLQEMAIFCAHHLDWHGADVATNEDMPAHMTLNVVMPYTGEEESWLTRQLFLVDEAFKSIPIPESTMHEFMMYSLGVPLSKSYMTNFFATIQEKIWRMYKVHADFEELPIESQMKVLRENSFSALALMIVKAEECPTGMDQMLLGFGADDEQKWREYYSTVFDVPKKIKKMSLKDNNQFNPDQVGKYSTLLSEAKDFINDPMLYKLTLLLTLFQPSAYREDNGLSNIYSKYVIVLRRRLEWMKTKKSAAVSPNEVLAKMHYNVKILNQIAMMLLSVGR